METKGDDVTLLYSTKTKPFPFPELALIVLLSRANRGLFPLFALTLMLISLMICSQSLPGIGKTFPTLANLEIVASSILCPCILCLSWLV